MRDTGYIVFQVEDAWHGSRCSNPEDVRMCIANMFETGGMPTVIQYEIDGYARDVTDEYRPEPPHEQDIEIDWRRGHTNHMRKIGSFAR